MAVFIYHCEFCNVEFLEYWKIVIIDFEIVLKENTFKVTVFSKKIMESSPVPLINIASYVYKRILLIMIVLSELRFLKYSRLSEKKLLFLQQMQGYSLKYYNFSILSWESLSYRRSFGLLIHRFFILFSLDKK